MAVTGTELYSVNNGVKTKIYPESDASVVAAAKGGDTTNVQSWLEELATSISDFADSALDFSIDVKYAQTIYSSENDVKNNENIAWGSNFVQPDAEAPYVWRKMAFIINSDSSQEVTPKYTYELVSIASETTQTLYTARLGDTKTVKINYGTYTEDGVSKYYYDEALTNLLQREGNSIWSTTPVSISATAPNGYIATRQRGSDGKWKAFEIVQNAKWAYNSIPTFKYQVTSTSSIPSVTEDSSDYSKVSGWSDTITSDFTGYLWMINATIVNDVYQLNGSKVWSSPTLISIVK